MPSARIPDEHRADVETLWRYHDLGHELRAVDVCIGLGSHDLGVATHAADLYGQGLFPLIVFTGANAPTTVERFPRGEAVHFREHAIARGVPADAVLTETRATNTAENLRLSRDLLASAGVGVRSVLLVSRPYQQRRAFATCRKLWPDVEVVCAAQALPLDDYVAAIGDADQVIAMLVGDTQRIDAYARRGFAIPQEIPAEVQTAYQHLVAAGFTARLI